MSYKTAERIEDICTSRPVATNEQASTKLREDSEPNTAY